MLSQSERASKFIETAVNFSVEFHPIKKTTFHVFTQAELDVWGKLGAKNIMML